MQNVLPAPVPGLRLKTMPTSNALPPYLPSAMSYQVAMESARSWQLISFGLLIMLFITFLLLFLLFPLKETEIRFLSIGAKEGAMVEIYPANLPQDQKALLVKREIMQFVDDAHEIDNITENNRYKRIHAMGTEAVYDALVANAREIIKMLKGGSREVEIVYVRDREEGLKEVEFITRDTIGDIKDNKKWEAIVKYHLSEAPIPGSNMLLNPLRIVVDKYHVREKTGERENEIL